MLQAKTKKELDKVVSILSSCVLDGNEYGVRMNDFVTYDQMAQIVDFLRTSDTQSELFETCWIAYRRKGIKKRSFEYWKKLSENEKAFVLPHIKAYVANRDVQFQKDFERYLRDRAFMEVVYANNKVVYDPTKATKGESEVYMPICGGALSWNDYYNCFMYVGYWDGEHLSDGYDDASRPDGASVVLNNGRGTIVWNAETKTWNKL